MSFPGSNYNNTFINIQNPLSGEQCREWLSWVRWRGFSVAIIPANQELVRRFINRQGPLRLKTCAYPENGAAIFNLSGFAPDRIAHHFARATPRDIPENPPLANNVSTAWYVPYRIGIVESKLTLLHRNRSAPRCRHRLLRSRASHTQTLQSSCQGNVDRNHYRRNHLHNSTRPYRNWHHFRGCSPHPHLEEQGAETETPTPDGSDETGGKTRIQGVGGYRVGQWWSPRAAAG